MNDIWYIRTYHNKECSVFKLMGTEKHVRQILKDQEVLGNYNGGYQVYSEETWNKHGNKKTQRLVNV